MLGAFGPGAAMGVLLFFPVVKLNASS